MLPTLTYNPSLLSQYTGLAFDNLLANLGMNHIRLAYGGSLDGNYQVPLDGSSAIQIVPTPQCVYKGEIPTNPDGEAGYQDPRETWEFSVPLTTLQTSFAIAIATNPDILKECLTPGSLWFTHTPGETTWKPVILQGAAQRDSEVQFGLTLTAFGREP